jgi:hypothetical protein
MLINKPPMSRQHSLGIPTQDCLGRGFQIAKILLSQSRKHLAKVECLNMYLALQVSDNQDN